MWMWFKRRLLEKNGYEYNNHFFMWYKPATMHAITLRWVYEMGYQDVKASIIDTFRREMELTRHFHDPSPYTPYELLLLEKQLKNDVEEKKLADKMLRH